MKKTTFLIIVLFFISSALVVDSFAQQGVMGGQGSGGWSSGSKYGRMYNPSTVETIKGEVVSVDKITPMQGMRYGVHLMVNTGKENISVHLGPGWYIENQDVTIEPKDKVEITGSRVTFDGKPAIIAKEVRKGEKLLILRDENGFPAWSGWRRGGRGMGGPGMGGGRGMGNQ